MIEIDLISKIISKIDIFIFQILLISVFMSKILYITLLALIFIACNGKTSESNDSDSEIKKIADTKVTPEKVDYKQKGLEYVVLAQKELGTQLRTKLKEVGVIGAVNYCNVEAMNLTKKLSEQNGVKISRVTDKPRNQNNLANDMELMYLEKFVAFMDAKQNSTPILTTKGEKVTYYYPITTKQMCTKCHGYPVRHIDPIDYAQIRILYPKDQAIGYNPEVIRGMWKIEM